MTRRQFLDYIEQEYGVLPDYHFKEDFDSAVFRHKDNRKWFGLVMQVSKYKLVGNEKRLVDVLNLKCEPLLRQPLMQNRGIYECYQMNKVHWISVILEEVELDEITSLVEMSFDLTKHR